MPVCILMPLACSFRRISCSSRCSCECNSSKHSRTTKHSYSSNNSLCNMQTPSKAIKGSLDHRISKVSPATHPRCDRSHEWQIPTNRVKGRLHNNIRNRARKGNRNRRHLSQVNNNQLRSKGNSPA